MSRTLAPFGRRAAEVAGARDVGAYRLLSVLDDAGPRHPRPGQFYMLAAVSGWGGGADERPYLPRAFSFCRAHDDGRLDFLLEAIGPGTARLAELVAGDHVWLVGPLGNGFEPDGTACPLLVGGGIGVAPLVALSDELPDAEVLLGFRSERYVQAASLFRAATEVATDDGSLGRRALVTDLLLEWVDGEHCVYGCGPPAMLEQLRLLAIQRDLRTQIALESGMACGFGACFGCVHPARDGYVRLCVDGPVLDARRLQSAWAEAERVAAA